MISNQNIFHNAQPSPKSKRNLFKFFGRRRSNNKAPIKESSSPQTRDPVGKPDESTDASQRESWQPILAPKSSIEALCYKLDMGESMPERLPRIDYSSKTDSADDMAKQTASIFRNVQLGANGNVVRECSRAARVNAGRGQRLGKRSRQADNINRARSLASFREANSDASPSQIVSLFVVRECDDLDDLIRYAPRKRVDDENKEPQHQDQPAKDTSSVFSTGTPQHLREIHVLV